MWNKMIAFDKNDIFNFTKENLAKYFTELDPLYVKDGPTVKQIRVFQAKSLTPFEKKTNYTPVVEIGKEKFVSIEKVQNLIAY